MSVGRSEMTYGDEVDGDEVGMRALESYVKRGKDFTFSVVVPVSPAMAEWLLKRNVSNRPINRNSVGTYKSDMVSGLWDLNGAPIIVSRDGYLNDGQNRLTAIVESGLTISTFITFGVTRESRMTVDQNKARTSGQYLAMSGVSYANECAATASLLLCYDRGVYGSVEKIRNVTKQDVREYFLANQPTIMTAAKKFKGRSATFGVTALAAAYIIVSGYSPSQADKFMDLLVDGATDTETLELGNPILTLRNRFSSSSKYTVFERLELILRYWRAWRDGATVVKGHALPLRGRWPKFTSSKSEA